MALSPSLFAENDLAVVNRTAEVNEAEDVVGGGKSCRRPDLPMALAFLMVASRIMITLPLALKALDILNSSIIDIPITYSYGTARSKPLGQLQRRDDEQVGAGARDNMKMVNEGKTSKMQQQRACCTS